MYFDTRFLECLEGWLSLWAVWSLPLPLTFCAHWLFLLFLLFICESFPFLVFEKVFMVHLICRSFLVLLFLSGHRGYLVIILLFISL